MPSHSRLLSLPIVAALALVASVQAFGQVGAALACSPAVSFSTDVVERAPNGEVIALSIGLTAQRDAPSSNALMGLRFASGSNVRVEFEGSGMALPSSVTLPPATASTSFLLRRVAPDQPSLLTYSVVDSCGELPRFAGVGTKSSSAGREAQRPAPPTPTATSPRPSSTPVAAATPAATATQPPVIATATPSPAPPSPTATASPMSTSTSTSATPVTATPTTTLASPAFTTTPTTPALASDAVVFNSDRTGHMEIFSMRADGSQLAQLTSGSTYHSWWGRISPDRRHILYYRTPVGGAQDDYTQTSLWVMDANGTGQRMLRARGADGWEVQGHAEWSPDGRQIVMFGGEEISPQVYVTNAEGADARPITQRGGTNVDPAWSPDGTTIVFAGSPQSTCYLADLEIYTVSAAGGAARRLTNNGLRDHDPYFSPDGTTIAWLCETQPASTGVNYGLGVWNILAMRPDGSLQRNVTNDTQINSKPQWAADGLSIVFHRFMPGLRDRWLLFAIRPDGAGLREMIVPQMPGNSEYPSV